MTRLGFNAHVAASGLGDVTQIQSISQYGPRGMWITGDLSSKESHRVDILQGGISVAWIRESSGGGKAQQMLLAYAIAYGCNAILDDSSDPAYFQAEERIQNGIATAHIERVQL